MELDSRLEEYARLVRSWPGLVGKGADSLALAQDALALLPHLDAARTLIDVAGAGMPGIPLKLARPDLEVALLEADRRKAAFLAHAAARLGIEVTVIPERAEDAGHGPHRERYDAACCRALARLPVAAELCLPLVRVGGRFLAMTTQGAESAGSAGRAIRMLGGGTLAETPAGTRLRDRGIVVVVEKVAPTPPGYPRRAGVPASRPLGG